MEHEPGSFRDREGRVLLRDGVVLRVLSQSAMEDWQSLSSTQLFTRAVSEGKIIPTRLADVSDEELAALSERWVGALEHERIPFISYPYEWSFSMLKQAALLHLELLLAALDDDLILKDSSAYNIQWRGSSPVHIDIPSFTRLQPGEAWVGYLQFCQLFLYPLMLTAYKNLPFQPWLRGAIDGINPIECRRIMSLRDHLRPGVLTHVFLQSQLQASTADSKTSMRGELRQLGFSKSLIVNNAGKLQRTVKKMRWQERRSEWVAYATDHSYQEEDERQKQEFVSRAVGLRHWKTVWDLGCNTGVYSRIAAENADSVVAIDGDHLAVERFFIELQQEGPGNILPLVMNLADPSPNLGWRGQERQSLTARGPAELILFLALIHHMVISANIPLEELVDWLAELGSHLVIEFVTKRDAMVQKLLLNKDDIYSDYELANFERCVDQYFETMAREALQEGTRVLYFLAPRKSSVA
jgi:hypothetical protein